MAKAPPTGGEWRAWYARLCTLIDRYHERQDDAGRLVRRLQREMASLWVFLCEHGVDTTNNRAERALRFGVLGHCVLWADEAEDEERSPDAGRETSEEQGGIKRCP